jgi:hypothetical protein
MAEDAQEENGLRVVPASEILAMIEAREPVNLDEVIIKEELNTTKLNLPLDEKSRRIVSTYIRISNSQFGGDVFFSGSRFGVADFSGSKFSGFAYFSYSHFNENASFSGSQFDVVANFDESHFSKDAYFVGSQFRGVAYFMRSQFGGEVLTFKDAIFKDPRSEEDACRRAKNVAEKSGNRIEAGNYFYREMEAKRKQKPWYIQYPEFVLIQLIFGYGVHPEWLMYWWLLVVCAFAFIYAIGDGINGATGPLEYIEVSFATAIAPGYIAAIITPGSTGYRLLPEYHLWAMAETIVGTFLWAGFIATFAKKYMK